MSRPQQSFHGWLAGVVIVSTYRFALKEYMYISRKEYKGYYDNFLRREFVERFDVY